MAHHQTKTGGLEAAMKIGMKNHNISKYLEMSLEDFLSGNKRSNDEYEVTNYLGGKA